MTDKHTTLIEGIVTNDPVDRAFQLGFLSLAWACILLPFLILSKLFDGLYPIMQIIFLIPCVISSLCVFIAFALSLLIDTISFIRGDD